MLDSSYYQDVRGAVYFPSRAYNAYQTWHELDTAEIDRDFGYAQQAGINALRMFTSYEYWQEAGEEFFNRFEQVIALSAKHGIRIMPVLFEDCGVDSTPEARASKDPRLAVCTCSPCRAVQKDPARWAEVYPYVDAFFRRYGSDQRLLAIEVMNEPHESSGNIAFAQHMVRMARTYQGTVPLTIGSIRMLHNLYYGDDLDIYQFHDNFPSTLEAFHQLLQEMQVIQQATGKPCWLTEWQRLRVKGPGWDVQHIDPEETVPALATLAPEVYGSGLGNFFWSLMVKPAYLTAQRPNGTFNGLFHEDGSVYSLADYQAVSHSQETRPVTATLPPWYMKSLAEN